MLLYYASDNQNILTLVKLLYEIRKQLDFTDLKEKFGLEQFKTFAFSILSFIKTGKVLN